MKKTSTKKFYKQKQLILKNEELWKYSSKIKTSPSVIIGNSPRSSLEKQTKPGPGAYDVNKSFLDKGLISFKGNKKIRFQTESPGPTAYIQLKSRYNPHLLHPSKKYSFQKSHNYNKSQSGPSPVSYQINSTVKVLAHSFSKKKRQFFEDKQKQQMPGPGLYNIKTKQLSQRQLSFSRTKKFKESETQQAEKKVVPGPGAYEISKYRHNVKTYKFTNALRNFSEPSQNPGPGHYSPQKSQLQHIGGIISKEIRKFQFQNSVPGPGAYEQVAIDKIKHKQPRPMQIYKYFRIPRSRQSSLQDKIQLGPGHYFKTSEKSKILGGVIGREKRNSTTVEIMPGPLSYQPQFYEVLSRTVSTVIGRQKRMKDCLSKTPGPGQYQSNKNQKLFSNSKEKRSSGDRRLNFTQMLKNKVQDRQRQYNFSALNPH